MAAGLRLVSGGTDNHLMLVDLRPKKLTGKVAEEALGKAGITVNKNMIPCDPEKPIVTSGIRVGTPALTTRGMGVAEMGQVASLIGRVLDAPADEASLARVRGEVHELTPAVPPLPRPDLKAGPGDLDECAVPSAATSRTGSSTRARRRTARPRAGAASAWAARAASPPTSGSRRACPRW